jgi:hypothetical protein
MNFHYWFELAVVFGLTAVGGIVFSAFAVQESRTRRLTKTVVGAAVTVLVSATLGRMVFFALLGLFGMAVFVIHGWWLPRNGVNGWTAEPQERYRALRGWQVK